MNDPSRVIVVCGFPRSGTSLLMQMFHAAGVRCLGEWPAFEEDDTNVIRGRVHPDVVARMVGGAMKVLDPQLVALPEGFNYDFVWTTRNRRQQALSNVKFLRTMFGGMIDDSPRTIRKFSASFQADEPVALAALQSHAGRTLHKISFEQLIEHPDTTTKYLSQTFSLPFAPMRLCIKPRRSDCLPYLMEFSQI